MNTTDKNNASFAYSVGLLKMLLEMQLITKEEYKKIVRISAAHYCGAVFDIQMSRYICTFGNDKADEES